MLEWTNRPVLKTGVLQGTVGSNPTPSASLRIASAGRQAMTFKTNRLKAKPSLAKAARRSPPKL